MLITGQGSGGGRSRGDDRGLLAAPAAVAVHNAQVLAQAVVLATDLQNASTSRPVIDQAIGVIRSRSGGASDGAFTRQRDISERTELVDAGDAGEPHPAGS